MTGWRFLAVVVIVLTGCGYERARPAADLAPHVHLADGGQAPTGTLGPVTAEATGWGACDELSRAALSDLLEDARALGGTDVAYVQYRQRWNWSGRGVCRRNYVLLGRGSVLVRGFAVRVPRPATTAVQRDAE